MIVLLFLSMTENINFTMAYIIVFCGKIFYSNKKEQNTIYKGDAER